jgi:cell division protein FtsW
MLWVFAAGATVLGGLVGAYTLLPHVADRVQRFLNPESGDTWQIDRAMDAFGHGGFLGVGPGEGQVKYLVPDAHTDFIFSVVGEEFGTLTCLVLAALFAFLVLRGLKRAMDMREGFPQLAAAGLFVMLGLQALINMAVNLNLMPAKGMTLPFVSYGGSSMLAVSLAMGLALALTRRRPQARGGQG